MDNVVSILQNLGHFSQVRHFVSKLTRVTIYFAPMQSDIQRQVLGAILKVLRPIARSLLRAGVGYREFSEIAKIAFVDTATKDYGLRGRPTNISRVAVMTGLTRKEVRRIRNKTDASEQTIVMKTTPVSHILHQWYTDEQFLTPSGQPKPLPFDGEGDTFSTLIRKHGGDVPPGAMRTELKRIDALQHRDDELLLPVKRIAYNQDLHERLVGGLARTMYPAALSLSHNLESSDTSSRWENLVVSSKFVRKNDRGRIKRISSDRISEFVKSMEDMYGAYDTIYEEGKESNDTRAVGIGVFYFEEDKAESDVFS